MQSSIHRITLCNYSRLNINVYWSRKQQFKQKHSNNFVIDMFSDESNNVKWLTWSLLLMCFKNILIFQRQFYSYQVHCCIIWIYQNVTIPKIFYIKSNFKDATTETQYIITGLPVTSNVAFVWKIFRRCNWVNYLRFFNKHQKFLQVI